MKLSRNWAWTIKCIKLNKNIFILTFVAGSLSSSLVSFSIISRTSWTSDFKDLILDLLVSRGDFIPGLPLLGGGGGAEPFFPFPFLSWASRRNLSCSASLEQTYINDIFNHWWLQQKVIILRDKDSNPHTKMVMPDLQRYP